MRSEKTRYKGFVKREGAKMAKRTKRLIEHKETLVNGEEGIRLNKYLSDAGFCSRREADKLIEAGEVFIDGQMAVVGSKVLPTHLVEVKGKSVKKDESLVLIAFNKPRGIVCTTDRREKDNIIDYIKYGKRIYPIGRLDKDSEGLILLTNDGNIVNKILRAGNNHEKEYIVTVNKAITAEFLQGMESGVPILDTITNPCEIKALDRFTFQIILTQGMNRQIRRMCEYFGYKVLTLKRIRIMNINLGHLQLGGYRNVTEKEISGINDLIRDSENAPSIPADQKIDKEILKTNLSNRQRTVTGYNKRSSDSDRKAYSSGKDNVRKEDGFKQEKSFKYESSIDKDKRSNKEKSYNKGTGFNKEKSYNKETGFNKEKNFNKEPGFDKNKGFNKESSFNKEKGYNKEKGFNKEKSYNKEKNFNKERSLVEDNLSGKDKPFNRERNFDKSKAVVTNKKGNAANYNKKNTRSKSYR